MRDSEAESMEAWRAGGAPEATGESESGLEDSPLFESPISARTTSPIYL